ncbi:MAG: rhomboid family intramembrane serine protease [Runella sp.]
MSSILEDIKREFSKSDNAVIKLILLNVIVFVAMVVFYVVFTFGQYPAFYEWIVQQLRLPAQFSAFLYKPWTLITNFFVHQGPFHIFFNMLSLYWFGRVLEEYIGSRRLVSIFILGGLAGGLAFLLLYNTLPYFQNHLDTGLIGASGAVFAIILAAATLLPDYTFSLLLIGPVRLKYIAAFCIILSMAQLVGPNAGGNVAHLAGALLGFGFIKSLRAGYDWGKPIYALSTFFQRLFTKHSTVRVPQRTRAATTTQTRRFERTPDHSTTTSIPNQDEIDAILDKISKSGYESLTRDEKQKLYQASQQ